jgi:hypothetical protein
MPTDVATLGRAEIVALLHAAEEKLADFPTDEELERLEREFEAGSTELTGATNDYIEGLQKKVAALTIENRGWSTADSKAVADLMRGHEALEESLRKIRKMSRDILEINVGPVVDDALVAIRVALEAIEKEATLEDDDQEQDARAVVEAIDFEAAKDAVAGIRSKLNSMAFAAPETMDIHAQDLEEFMEELGKALGEAGR